MILRLNFIIKILFLLIPIALVSGPFIPDLFLCIIDILFLIILFKKKDFTIFKERFFYLFALFYLALILSSLFSNNIIASLSTSVPYVRFIIFSFAVYYLISVDKSVISYLSLVLIFLFTVLFLDSLIQFIYGKNLIGLKITDSSWTRISSFFGEELKLGSFSIRFLPILLATIPFLGIKKNKENILIIFLTAMTCILVYLSSERSSFFLLLLFLFSYMFIINLRYIFIILLLFIFMASTITFFNENFNKRLFSYTSKQIGVSNILSPDKKITIFSDQHESHYRTALKMFESSIFIGIGPKSFRFQCDDLKFKSGQYSCSTHPHNSYIQILAETGIFGFIYLFVLLLYFLIKFFQILKKKIDKSESLIILAILISLFPFVPSGNFFNNWLSIIYYFPAGIYLFKIKK
jgi:O-antigen ligase